MNRLFVIATLIVNTISFGQEINHEKIETPRKGKMEIMKDLSPEQMATLKTKKMTLALDLTKSQQDKIYALNLKNAKELKVKMQARKNEKENQEGNRIELSSDEKYKRINNRLDKQIAIKKELSAILTKEQLEKMEQIKKMRKMKMKKAHMRKKLEN